MIPIQPPTPDIKTRLQSLATKVANTNTKRIVQKRLAGIVQKSIEKVEDTQCLTYMPLSTELQYFTEAVERERGDDLTETDADVLTANAEHILDSLESDPLPASLALSELQDSIDSALALALSRTFERRLSSQMGWLTRKVNSEQCSGNRSPLRYLEDITELVDEEKKDEALPAVAHAAIKDDAQTLIDLLSIE